MSEAYFPLNIKEFWKFSDEKIKTDNIPYVLDRAMFSENWVDKNSLHGRYYINTRDGSLNISDGDYIIKTDNGEIYLIKKV